MREYPILFSGEMVRAILEGRKTQTRRVIKNWPPKIFLPNPVCGDWPIGHRTIAPAGIYQPSSNPNGALSVRIGDVFLGIKPGEFEWVCPYGKPGDRLWVRETFRWADKLVDGYDRSTTYYDQNKASYYLQYKADGVIGTITGQGIEKPGVMFEEYLSKDWSIRDDFGKWKPSIHMPRWASRITLEVVNIKVERLLMISYANCIAEGIVDVPRLEKRVSLPGERPYEQYRVLWDSLNAKRGYGWNVNPWVWVVEFEVVI